MRRQALYLPRNGVLYCSDARVSDRAHKKSSDKKAWDKKAIAIVEYRNHALVAPTPLNFGLRSNFLRQRCQDLLDWPIESFALGVVLVRLVGSPAMRCIMTTCAMQP